MDISSILKIPKIEDCKSILCVQPHPDDNEVGAGGTIAKLSRLGCKVTYLTVTDGGMGTINPEISRKVIASIRAEEAEKAAAILGVSELFNLNYADASYMDEKELCQKIVTAIRDVKPEFVMTVDPFLPYEVHPDHRIIGMAAAEACLFSQFPNFYSYWGKAPCKNPWTVQCVAFYSTAYPNTIIDVDDTWDIKMNAISAHKSQFPEEDFAKYKMYLEYKSKELASGKGFNHAEGFKILPPVLLHGNVDAINM